MVIRIARPGLPTEYIDHGPANGRMTGQRHGTRGTTVNGSFVVGTSERQRANAAQREYMAKQRELFTATTPERRAQMAAYKAGKRAERQAPGRGQAFSIHPENRDR